MLDSVHSIDGPIPSTANSSADASQLSKHTIEKKIDVHNFVLLKRVAENVDEELSLVATFTQRIWHDTDKELSAIDTGSIIEESITEKTDILSKRAFFDYRINDIGADGTGWIKPRRVEMNLGKCKKTIEANIPLRIEDDYECFPFKIVTASVTIELSSSCIHDQRKRPNLLLHGERKSENVCIQGLLPFDLENENINGKDDIERFMKKKLDDCKSYDFVTPYPEVSYMYDKKKGYCPKFKITFYMVESGVSKFVTTVSPMLLITILNTVQVFDTLQGEIETVNFLGNAASFALTAVFILPSIISKGNISVVLNKNNIYILLIFIGLALSSLPDRLLGTSRPAVCGLIILWLSFVFPLWGFVAYFRRISKIKKQSPKEDDRLSIRLEISDYMKTPRVKSAIPFWGFHKYGNLSKIKQSPTTDDHLDVEKAQITSKTGENILENNTAVSNPSADSSEKHEKETSGREAYHTVDYLAENDVAAKYSIKEMKQFFLLRS